MKNLFSLTLILLTSVLFAQPTWNNYPNQSVGDYYFSFSDSDITGDYFVVDQGTLLHSVLQSNKDSDGNVNWENVDAEISILPQVGDILTLSIMLEGNYLVSNRPRVHELCCAPMVEGIGYYCWSTNCNTSKTCDCAWYEFNVQSGLFSN